jgi:TrmH family RNA methyltransferase
MLIAPITSRHNERLKELRKLRERKHRRQVGAFAGEGEDLLLEARRADVEPLAVYFDPDRIDAGDPLLGDLPETTALVPVAADALESASTLGSGSRVIAVFPERWSGLEQIGAAQTALYLHEVADPGNVGTVLRSARALANAFVVLSPGGADPFGPKAVRASMGAVLAQPFARAELEQAKAAAGSAWRSVALVPGEGRALHELRGGAPTLYCLGSERTGLPPDIAASCDEVAHIPLRGEATDSLNVAVAATICLYEHLLHKLSNS